MVFVVCYAQMTFAQEHGVYEQHDPFNRNLKMKK